MSKIKINYVLLICISALIWSGCNTVQPSDDSTPTSGKINIAIDETFAPVMDSQVSTFNSLYTRANVTAQYVSESEAFRKLIQDSVRLIIASRTLNENEKKVFEEVQIRPRITKVAVDALALIINRENKDTTLRYEQLPDIFSGKTANWKQLNPNSDLGAIKIIFDNKGSGTARYAKEKLNKNQALPANCYAANSNAAVIDYVSQHPEAIGVIGVNWISDNDDPAVKGFLNKIKVMAIAPPDTGKVKREVHYYKPYQAYVAQKVYPLTRDIFIVSREARTGLGSGFTAFVAGDKGQRIILKSGLLPSTMPVRLVEIK